VVPPTLECVEVKLLVQLTPPQLAVQSTPRFAGSPVTVAARVKVAPAGAVCGGNCVMTTLVTEETSVTVDAAVLLRSVLESAVTAIFDLDGTETGAVKVVAAPLSVCWGEKLPQLVVLAHVAIQSTPALAGSSVTVAETCAWVPTGSVDGGNCTIAMDMSGVCEGGVCGRLVEHPAIPQKAMRTKASEARTGEPKRPA